MQYHASFRTADGAYHCPVGSIMAIFKSELCSIWLINAKVPKSAQKYQNLKEIAV